MSEWFGSQTFGRAVASPVDPDELVLVLDTEYYRDLPFSSDVHAGFELAILVTGRQQRSTADSTVMMVPGDVFLSPAWEPHGWRNLAKYTRVVNIHFVPRFLGNEEFAGESWLSMFACSLRERPRVRSDGMRAKVLAIAKELTVAPSVQIKDRWHLDASADSGGEVFMARRWIRPGGAGLPVAWEEEMRLITLRLLLLLFRGWVRPRQARARRLASPSDLAQIMPAITLTIPSREDARRVDLHEAARACNLSLTTFRRVFRRTMGMTFGRFELQQRAAKAEDLLLKTDLSLAAIAEKCDFTDVSHLHRTFGRFYRETPGRYRTLVRKIGK